MNTDIQKIKSVPNNVLVMRSLQKKYYKDRLIGDLHRCKQYESIVDREVFALVKELGEDKSTQGSLFDAPSIL